MLQLCHGQHVDATAGSRGAAVGRAAQRGDVELAIPSIAVIARSARVGSGSANSSSIPVGTTCQDKP